MKKIILIPLTLLILLACNNKEPFDPPYDNIGGYVLGKETCSTDTSSDYWLIDFTVYNNSPKIGDTLTLNGINYTNVLKVRGLGERLRQIGMRVSIDYDTVTPNAIVTSGCNVANPMTYSLKEIFIINQFEIR